MKGRRKNNRFGTLLFIVPIVLVAALVAYAIVDTTSFGNGTLIIRAQTSTKYYSALYLNVTVTAAGKSGTTPLTLSLPQGTYTVTFPSQQWFTPPPSRTVNLTSRGDSFVVGVYNPIPVSVSVNQDKFNTTKITVLHRVTPLIWVNPTQNYAVISSDLTGRIIIPPLQNATYVFQNPGSYVFTIVGSTSASLQVSSV